MTMTDGLWDKSCPYDHTESHGSAMAQLSELPLMWDLMGFHPLCWNVPGLLSFKRARKTIICSCENFLLALSASTSLRGNMAVIDPLVQDWISNSKCTCGKHCSFTHQLLMMNFISWVMPELRIHLHFRYLFCFNVGQPGTCIAPPWQFIKATDSITLCLPPPLQGQKPTVSSTREEVWCNVKGNWEESELRLMSQSHWGDTEWAGKISPLLNIP